MYLRVVCEKKLIDPATKLPSADSANLEPDIEHGGWQADGMLGVREACWVQVLPLRW